MGLRIIQQGPYATLFRIPYSMEPRFLRERRSHLVPVAATDQRCDPLKSQPGRLTSGRRNAFRRCGGQRCVNRLSAGVTADLHNFLPLRSTALYWIFLPSTSTLWPSGLRRWTQVPLSSDAWVRTPQVSLGMMQCRASMFPSQVYAVCPAELIPMLSLTLCPPDDDSRVRITPEMMVGSKRRTRSLGYRFAMRPGSRLLS